MLCCGRPINTCIGAVANEFDNAGKAGGVVGSEVIIAYIGCKALKLGADYEGEDTIVTDGGKDGSLVILGNPNLKFDECVMFGIDGWSQGTNGGHGGVVISWL